MSDQEILEKAIQKAIVGGYKSGKEWLSIIHNTDFELFMLNQTYALIFSHDFAKALWGNDVDVIVYVDDLVGEVAIPRDEFHLQQMVIANDPIKYLGENI